MTLPSIPNILAPAAQRNTNLDAARGFAILGLIFANIPSLASADFYRMHFLQTKLLEGGDSVGRFLIEFLIGGKCVALLSFLLGVGLAMQQSAAAAAGRSFTILAARRMAALFGIGLLHILLLWWGDILCIYALLGFGVILVHRAPPWVVRGIAVLCIVLPILIPCGMWLISGAADPETGKEAVRQWEDYIRTNEQAYQRGSYWVILQWRIQEALFMQMYLLFLLPVYFGFVLLGYDATRSGWFLKFERSLSPWVALSLVGLALQASGICSWISVWRVSGMVAGWLAWLCWIPAGLGLGLFYLWVCLRLPNGRIVRMLSAVGRTALSNYLFQSLCAAVIFQGWGLGFYGRMSYGQTLLVAGGIVALQLAWPIWWLRRFRYGPMEYVWRLLTYGKAAGKMRLA